MCIRDSTYKEHSMRGTHLADSLHRFMFLNLDRLHMQARETVLTNDRSLVPVSYTHLDVYKRQVLPSKPEEKSFLE